MSTNQRPGVTPIKILPPQPASLCSVEILKYVRTYDGQDKVSGRGTGFHFRDPSGTVWLVTNWHVLTGRRPDDPSKFAGDAMTSPTSIGVAYQSTKDGQFLTHLKLALYEKDGTPAWYEYRRDNGVDLAALPIQLPEDVKCPCVQDFADRDSEAFVPGLALTIVGMAFPHSSETPYPIWKGARVASEPSYLAMGVPQVLIDTAGVPGMSGSPIYRISRGLMVPPEAAQALKNFNSGSGGSALKLLSGLDLSQAKEGNVLRFVGVYAGSTGSSDLEKLSLGRMFLASLVDLLVVNRQLGINPFPPEFHELPD
jgi:hypothetical protein